MVDGFVPVIKPPGMSTYDIIRFLKGKIGGKVGFSGVLDPLATGVVVLALGEARKFLQHLPNKTKIYSAEFLLGATTPSLDLEEPFSEVTPPKDPKAALEAAKRELLGLKGKQFEFAVPNGSAKKAGGKTFRKKILEVGIIDTREDMFPRISARFVVEKGTYIRSVAWWLGERLRIPVCLSFLVREEDEGFRIEESYLIQEVMGAKIGEIVVPVEKAFRRAVEISPMEVKRLASGLEVFVGESDGLAAITCGAELVGVGEVKGGVLKPLRLVDQRRLVKLWGRY